MMNKEYENIAAMMPRLTEEQKQYLEDLSPEAQEFINGFIGNRGQDYFIDNFVMLKDQMEYVSTLL